MRLACIILAYVYVVSIAVDMRVELQVPSIIDNTILPLSQGTWYVLPLCFKNEQLRDELMFIGRIDAKCGYTRYG